MGKGGMAMVKTYEELELKDDFMFSVIMRDPRYVKPFLETILRIKIAKIEYPEVQKNIDIAAGAKGIRLDVYVEDEKHIRSLTWKCRQPLREICPNGCDIIKE